MLPIICVKILRPERKIPRWSNRNAKCCKIVKENQKNNVAENFKIKT